MINISCNVLVTAVPTENTIKRQTEDKNAKSMSRLLGG